jgi:hypothetical protein
VDLAETAVRSLYRTWTDAVNAEEEAEREEAEEEMDGYDAEGSEEDDGKGGRRLEEARRYNLIEEAGWMHLAHERRDFVFVDGESAAIMFFLRTDLMVQDCHFPPPTKHFSIDRCFTFSPQTQ